MEGLAQFNIKFVHLKPGRYTYNFSVGNEFFDKFDYSLVDKADIQVHCTMVKEKETLLHFQFEMDGLLTLNCDRCLDEFDFPIHSVENLTVKITDNPDTETENNEEEEDLVALPSDAMAFNVAKPIFDYLNLTKPMKPSCETVNKACNKEMIDILDNMQKRSNKDDQDIDPRWEDLKKFYNKNNN